METRVVQLQSKKEAPALWKAVSKLRRYPVVPMTIIALVVLAAILADLVTPYSPYDVSLATRLSPPSLHGVGGNPPHLLGTDQLGRDVLSRLIYGSRASLVVSVLAVATGAAIGGVIGLISGYFGGRLDTVLMRVTDAALAFPIIFIALILVVTLGPSFANVILAIGLVVWARYARVIRGELLSLRERDFVSLAKLANLSSLRIIARHLIPNVANTFMVLVSLQVGWAIITEASLSFLGAGVPPPTPTWGSMVADGRNYIANAWWLSVCPGVAIALTVLAFNLFGDWLRDILDPKLRQV